MSSSAKKNQDDRGQAHQILHENNNLFIDLFILMLSSGMPELQTHQDQFLVNSLSDVDFYDVFKQTGDQISTQFNFVIHNIVR